MQKIMILLMVLVFSSTIAYSEERKETLPDNCFEEYKISPKTLSCKYKKGTKRLITKSDGSYNFLGKFFNAKTHKDLFK